MTPQIPARLASPLEAGAQESPNPGASPLERRPTAKRNRARRRGGSRLRALAQLMGHFAGTGRWWLIPLVVVLLLSAVILIGIKVVQYAAPFVYTLF